MSNTIQVTTSTITNKASELKQLNSRFKSQVENLKSVEASLNSMWDGEANDAFHNAFTKDSVQMNNFYNAIEQYVAKLNEIARRYDAAEKTNLNTATQRKY